MCGNPKIAIVRVPTKVMPPWIMRASVLRPCSWFVIQRNKSEPIVVCLLHRRLFHSELLTSSPHQQHSARDIIQSQPSDHHVYPSASRSPDEVSLCTMSWGRSFRLAIVIGDSWISSLVAHVVSFATFLATKTSLTILTDFALWLV